MLTSVQSMGPSALARLFSLLEGPGTNADFGTALTEMTNDVGEETSREKAGTPSIPNLDDPSLPQQQRAKDKERVKMGGFTPPTIVGSATSILAASVADVSLTLPQQAGAHHLSSSKPDLPTENVKNSEIANLAGTVRSSPSALGRPLSAYQRPEISFPHAVASKYAHQQPSPGTNVPASTPTTTPVPEDMLMDAPSQSPATDIRKLIFDAADAPAWAALAGRTDADLAAQPTLDSDEALADGGAVTIARDPGAIAEKCNVNKTEQRAAPPASSAEDPPPGSAKLSGIAADMPSIANLQASWSIGTAENSSEYQATQATVAMRRDESAVQHPSAPDRSFAKNERPQGNNNLDAVATQSVSVLKFAHRNSSLGERGTPIVTEPSATSSRPPGATDHPAFVANSAEEEKSKKNSTFDGEVNGEIPANRATQNAAPAVPASANVPDISTSNVHATAQTVQIPSSATQQIAFTQKVSNTSAPDPTSAQTQAAQAPQVHAARIIQSGSDSQMRLEMRTRSFGDIEIHATVSGKQVQVSVVADHGDLRSFLAPEIPVLQDTLKQHDLRLEHVRTYLPNSDVQPDFSSGSGKQEHKFPRPSTRVTDDYSAEEPTERCINDRPGAKLSIRI